MKFARQLAIWSIALFVAGMLFAGTSSAVTYSMTGKTGLDSGPVVDIPASGPAACFELDNRVGFPASTMLTSTQTGMMLLPPTPYPRAPALPNGCVPGGSLIPGSTGNWTASHGASAASPGGAFTIPVGFFSLPGTSNPANVRNVPVPPIPKLVQLATALSQMGPYASGSLLAPRTMATMLPTVGTAGLAPWRAFKAGAWASQTGRVGSHFTWCPAATIPPYSMGIGGGGTTPGAGCASAAAGTRQLIVRYDPKGSGLGGFGGTMATTLKGVGAASSLAVATPFGGVAGSMSLGFNIIGGGGPGAENQWGKGYATYRAGTLPSGAVYMSHTLLGTAPYSVVGMVSGGVVGAISAGSFTGIGFPFTTGRVVARNTGKTGAGMANPQTVTASGTDFITGNGARNIQMVAGQMRSAVIGVATFTPGIGHLSVTLHLPEPGVSLGLGAGAAALLGMAALRRRRQR